MHITFRTSEIEDEIIRRYAAMKGMTVSDFVRNRVLESIEDEIDLEAYKKAYSEYLADPKTYTHDEVGEMLGFK